MLAVTSIERCVSWHLGDFVNREPEHPERGRELIQVSEINGSSCTHRLLDAN